MPRYDYECKVCGEVFERFRDVAKLKTVNHCGRRAKLVISSPQIDRFRPRFVNDLDVNPVFVTSGRALDREAKKRGVTVERLRDGRRR